MNYWLLIILAVVLAVFIIGLARRGQRVFSQVCEQRRPAFYFHPVEEQELGTPVFTYHSIANETTPDSVTAQAFEQDLVYLAENGYRTISADAFYGYLVNGDRLPPKSVVLTFDDGRASFWTTAFPILKKYGTKAVCFLIPAYMQQEGIRPFYDNIVTANPREPAEVDVDLGSNPFVTWAEVERMHASGLVDFQSHTIDHSRIFISPEIIDFVYPDYFFGFNGYQIPVLSNGIFDLKKHEQYWGLPIYQNDSRMGPARRYYEDETTANLCIDHVRSNGGRDFFSKTGWREELLDLCKKGGNNRQRTVVFEGHDEQIEAIRSSLLMSKQAIESHLPGHTVRHLCYPWHRYSSLANHMAREVGYVSAWIDNNPEKYFDDQNDAPYRVNHRIPSNKPGDDPFYISRIDTREQVLLSLPGKGRLTLKRRILSEVLRLPIIVRRVLRLP